MITKMKGHNKINNINSIETQKKNYNAKESMTIRNFQFFFFNLIKYPCFY